MIQTIKNGITDLFEKRNWIDQNSIVFGYDDRQHCCEDWGWGVFDPVTGMKVADDPSGLPYHFDFESGARVCDTCSESKDLKKNGVLGQWEFVYCLDAVQIDLLSDDGIGKRLVFQCYTQHNGYYLHDFSLEKKSILDNPPRLGIIRGLPGSGKSTTAKPYNCIVLEDDMFAIKGGCYHFNDADGSGMNTFIQFDETCSFIMRKRHDLVVAAVLPYCSPNDGDVRGHSLYSLLENAREYGYEVYMKTMEEHYGNVHGCPGNVYGKTFLQQNELIEQIGRYFSSDFVESIKDGFMPMEIVVHNELKNEKGKTR